MAIGPDGQKAMHVGMASFPHPASSRARPSAPTILHRVARTVDGVKAVRMLLRSSFVNFR